MMQFRSIAAAAVLAASLTASLSRPALADERLVTVLYQPDKVIRIEGHAGVQATISFGETEHIENVAVGDSDKWQITPNKRADLLFVKPLSATARTNMTVVTDQRTYFFDLAASPRSKPVYLLRFTYPPEARPKGDPAKSALAAQTPGASLNPAERQVLDGEAPVDPAALNFAWKRGGSAKLLPARVYDDGNSTYLSWSADQAVPAILVRNDKGEEGPVNFAVRGNTIVLDTVPRLIVLRTGKAQALLENQGQPRKPAPLDSAEPQSAGPQSGMTAPAAASGDRAAAALIDPARADPASNDPALSDRASADTAPAALSTARAAPPLKQARSWPNCSTNCPVSVRAAGE